ncbi:153_t:CDS:1, partial [Diversispora eburnea]
KILEFEPFTLNKIKIPDSEKVNQIIASIDLAILANIKKHTFLQLSDLIASHPKKNRFQKEPRPQNPFVIFRIFRRNIQAKINADLGPHNYIMFQK